MPETSVRPQRPSGRRAVTRAGTLVAAVLAMLAAVSWSAAPPAAAQQAAAPAEGGALMIVMDASGSMRADDGSGRSKLDGAKAALKQAVAGLPDGAVAGLLVYGARTPSTPEARAAGCQDTQVVVPPAPLDRARMTAAIEAFAASGYTPIGRALQDAAAALPASGPRTVLLVSDGLDTCAPPDPCTVAGQLAKSGVELKIETVGFQVDPGARAQLQCIAQAAGGQYSDAADSGALAQRLVDAATRAARSYTTKGSPVKGGASYQDAPVLTPGTYTDALLTKEQSWYAVDLQEGQQLTARSTLAINDGAYGGAGSIYEVQLVGPDLQDLCCSHGRGYQVNIGFSSGGARSTSVSADTGVVGAPDGPAKKAGRYYVRITTTGNGASVEYPVELDLAVTGGTAPGATAAPPPSATASPPAQEPAQGSDRSTLMMVIGGLSLLVFGLGAAVVVLLRRNRALSRERSRS